MLGQRAGFLAADEHAPTLLPKVGRRRGEGGHWSAEAADRWLHDAQESEGVSMSEAARLAGISGVSACEMLKD
jgi:hypothetical protein